MFEFMIASGAKPMIILRNAERPTVGDLRSGDFCFLAPRYRTNSPPRPRKRRPPPHQIDLHAPLSTWASNVHLNLTAGKKLRRFPISSEDFLSWPKVELKSSEDFPMLAQRIRNVSKVHPSILKTNRFLIYWRSSNQTVCYMAMKTKKAFVIVPFNMWFCG